MRRMKDRGNRNEEEGSSKFGAKLFMWEFGQNDPKRDSGSKLVRMKYARLLKLGESFNGVVLSSEARIIISPLDRDIVLKAGIAGINCSWNKLETIPFDKMGKGRHQRLLPFLLAANTVNYGKPFKLNTAEALAACLYITGFTEEAVELLSPFSFGEEFIRLNFEALEIYRQCQSLEEIVFYHQQYEEQVKERETERDQRRQESTRNGANGGYLDESDLPPMNDEEDGEEGGEEGGEGDDPLENNDERKPSATTTTTTPTVAHELEESMKNLQVGEP